MLGRRHQKYQKVDVDIEPKDLFGPAGGGDTPPRRIFTSACLWRSFYTAVLIGIYFAPSIGLTFYQRWLYKSFKSPLFTVCIHMIVKLILAVIIRSVIALKFGRQRLNLTWKEYLLAIAPAGVFSGIDIGFSNWGLELITVSLYTMAKSTTIIFILVFAILFKLEKKSWSLATIVTMISFGLCLVTYKASEFNLLGFILVLIASISSGVRWTCVQMLMQKSKLGMKSPIDMIYHMQGFMIISVLPFMVVMEGSKVVEEFSKLADDDSNEMSWLIFKILAGAFIAFLMEFSEVMVVSYTSSLTLSIAGIFKELFMLFLAFLTGDKFSAINVVGLIFCIGGIIIHVVHKISVLQAHTRTYEFDESDSYDFGVGKSLLEEQEIEQMHLTSESEEEQDSQEIFNILNRHDR